MSKRNFAQTTVAALAGVVSSAAKVPDRRSSAKVRIVSNGKTQSNGSQKNQSVDSTGVRSLGARLASMSAKK
jgi:hypothetical protein